MAGRTPGFEPDSAEGKWIDPPYPEVVLRGRRMPTAVLVVRGVDLGTGTPLPNFRCQATAPLGGSVLVPGRDGEGRAELRLPEDAPEAAIRVVLVDPRMPEEVAGEAVLRRGEETVISLGIPTGDSVVGTVVDAKGDPVSGARVYLGGPIRARGDEPFKPFDLGRVKDAVTTGEDGRYELSGEGREVTAWHPDLSPVTVPVETAGRIEMPPRGEIRGRLLDASGGPVAGAEVVLDRVEKARTDDEGRFRFSAVAAGVRGLALPGRRFVAVRVRPGEKLEAEIPAGIGPVRFELVSGGAAFPLPPTAKYGAVLVGLDAVGGVYGVRAKPGDTSFTVEGVIPGRYLLLLSSGQFAIVTVRADLVVADLGTGSLVVRGTPNSQLWVLPAAAAKDELARLLAGRAVFLGLPDSGEARIAPLPAGACVVGCDETTGAPRFRAVEVEVGTGEGEAELGR